MPSHKNRWSWKQSELGLYLSYLQKEFGHLIMAFEKNRGEIQCGHCWGRIPVLVSSIQWNSAIRLSEDLGAVTQSSTNSKWQGLLSGITALCVHISFKLQFLSKRGNFCYFEVVALVHLSTAVWVCGINPWKKINIYIDGYMFIMQILILPQSDSLLDV